MGRDGGEMGVRKGIIYNIYILAQMIVSNPFSSRIPNQPSAPTTLFCITLLNTSQKTDKS